MSSNETTIRNQNKVGEGFSKSCQWRFSPGRDWYAEFLTLYVSCRIYCGGCQIINGWDHWSFFYSCASPSQRDCSPLNSYCPLQWLFLFMVLMIFFLKSVLGSLVAISVFYFITSEYWLVLSSNKILYLFIVPIQTKKVGEGLKNQRL